MSEAILDPDLPIIDPHHHLWDLRPLLPAFPQPRHPFIEAIAEHVPLLAKGDDASFMNKVALATGNVKQKPYKKEQPSKKERSHIHQARQKPAEMPKTGPMADMLKKLFGDKK